MSGPRRKAIVVAGVLAAGVAAWGSPGTAADNRHEDRWWNPPGDVRPDARPGRRAQPRALRPRAGRLRHAPHAVDPGRSAAAASARRATTSRPVRRRSPPTSGGRMTVELQSYVQQPAPRIPAPTRITNVVATLRGTDPTSADRVYVVGAHYDSRVTDVLNATSDAPGANDDGSGTAAVHRARPRAWRRARPRRRSSSSRSRARSRGCTAPTTSPSSRRQNGWNIQGVLNMDIIGSPDGGNGVRDPRTIRLFSEGVPTSETPAERPPGASRSAARTTASRASSRATSRRPARTARPACA